MKADRSALASAHHTAIAGVPVHYVVDVVDPRTNETHEVSPRYVWIDHSGNIVGTNTSARPDTDSHQLLPKSSS